MSWPFLTVRNFNQIKICRTASPLILIHLCGFVLSWASNVSERICSAISWDLVFLLPLSTREAAMTVISLTKIIETSETEREQNYLTANWNHIATSYLVTNSWHLLAMSDLH